MMTKYRLLLLLCVAFLSAVGQQNNQVTIGTIDSVYSQTLKETRRVWVYVPNSGPVAIYQKQKYPVVYLLDGDGHFGSVVGMIQQLSEVNGNSVCPPMIVVGITNTDRTRDLTPTHVSSGPELDSNFVRTSGGGENFTSFLEKELIPYIDSTYPTAPYRMMIGHSLGGLMVLNTLVHHPHLFNAYLAIDPSLWWDNQKLLKQATTALARQKFTGKSLFLAIANTMQAGMDTTRVQKDTSNNSLHIRSMLQLAGVLKKNPGNGLHWSYKYYPDDDHGSVPLIAEYDALRFLFDFYKLPPFDIMMNKDIQADSVLATHFRRVSGELGYTVLPPEPLVNGMGYGFMQNNMMEKAYGFFQLNIRNYPQSFNVYDSMGDWYQAKGDKEKAIEYFTRALSLNEAPFTREKLERLKGGK
jgi:uncharacterized protein